MIVGVLGVNHKCADLSFREKLASACSKRFSPQRATHIGRSFILLSTCNRTEIYFCSDDLAATHGYILKVLRYDIEEEFEHRLYSYFNYDCFLHLARVTAGMDSAILAETEIQGQVKNAYEQASLHSDLAKELHFMFQKSLKIAKEVRTKFLLGSKHYSLEEAILHVAAKHTRKVLFLGASQINQKLCKALFTKNITDITLCNRNEQRVFPNVKQLPWQEKSRWSEFSLVIVATKAEEYLLKKEDASLQTQVLIDLSVPRNIDPELASFNHITLLNIDELNHIVNRNKQVQNLSSIDHWISKSVHFQIASFFLKEKKRLQSNFA